MADFECCVILHYGMYAILHTIITLYSLTALFDEKAVALIAVILGGFLVIENVRVAYGAWIHLKQKYQTTPKYLENSAWILAWTGKCSYFGHEVITPFAIMFAPFLISSSKYLNYMSVFSSLSVLISVIFAVAGFRRWLKLISPSKTSSFTFVHKAHQIKDNLNAAYQWSPAHPHSMTALIPIVIGVVLLIVVGVVIGDKQLWIFQLIVFLGNGVVQSMPSRSKYLYGNFLEVLWLGSISQSIMQT